ncbi:MAG TPA: Crp/Fnr family transcriptional regulator [Xanthobacteraceae bacterium]|nr:Crp/Fnr family transcriptional regulator [Xanthobacteraceae bacterium]
MTERPPDMNAFLAGLSPADFELFRSHLASFTLSAGDRLHEVGARADEVVFPHTGLVALTIPMATGAGAGAILVGRDGVVGALAAAASVPAVCDAEVLIAGRAARMSASAFRHALDCSPTVRRLAARFDAALMAQAQQTALCNAAHAVEARICRLLLEVNDRTGGGAVALTQHAVAQMLGVQRTTVNLALGQLEAAGVIVCARGSMQIANREKLKRASCECHLHFKACLVDLFAQPVERAPALDALASRARG